MTIQELSLVTGRSVVTLQKNWNRTKENLAKKGIYIDREGRKGHLDYSISFENNESQQNVDL